MIVGGVNIDDSLEKLWSRSNFLDLTTRARKLWVEATFHFNCCFTVILV